MKKILLLLVLSLCAYGYDEFHGFGEWVKIDSTHVYDTRKSRAKLLRNDKNVHEILHTHGTGGWTKFTIRNTKNGAEEHLQTRMHQHILWDNTQLTHRYHNQGMREHFITRCTETGVRVEVFMGKITSTNMLVIYSRPGLEVHYFYTIVPVNFRSQSR